MFNQTLTGSPTSVGRPIRIAGRQLHPTAVFDTYWTFAQKRQKLYFARLNNEEEPWTGDEILRNYRFTNVFRVTDRVSQHLVRSVIYGPGLSEDPTEVIFRTLLFKLFNKIETWEELKSKLGEVTWRSFDNTRYSTILDNATALGPVYSAAYVIPPPRLGEVRKHRNHLRLLELMMRDGITGKVLRAKSLREVYEILISYPSIGPFLAYQFSIDLNYSSMLDCNENDFVVAGPGARDGIEKCFGRAARGIESEVIRYMAAEQERHFVRLDLDFDGLYGRDLHLIDAQNLFCEVDKYSRVAHPEIPGISGRSRIKQKFRPKSRLTEPVFPPKWELNPRPPVSEAF